MAAADARYFLVTVVSRTQAEGVASRWDAAAGRRPQRRGVRLALVAARRRDPRCCSIWPRAATSRSRRVAPAHALRLRRHARPRRRPLGRARHGGRGAAAPGLAQPARGRARRWPSARSSTSSAATTRIMNPRAVLVGTSMLPSVGQQLWSDRVGPSSARSLPPMALALVWPRLLDGWRQSRAGRSRMALDVATLALLAAVFVADVPGGGEQAAAPDVLYLASMGRLAARALGRTTTCVERAHPGPRTPLPVPAVARGSPRRSVLFVVTESVRATDAAASPRPTARRRRSRTRSCRTASASRRCARSTPRRRCRSPSCGAACRPPRRARRCTTAPLLWEYAHAAGFDTAYWTSQNLFFAQLRDLARGASALALGERDRPRSEPDLRDRRRRRRSSSTSSLRDLPSMVAPVALRGRRAPVEHALPVRHRRGGRARSSRSRRAFGAGDAADGAQPLPRRDPPAGRRRRAARARGARACRAATASRSSSSATTASRSASAAPIGPHLGRVRRGGARPLLDRRPRRVARGRRRRRAFAALREHARHGARRPADAARPDGHRGRAGARDAARDRCRARACCAAGRPAATRRAHELQQHLHVRVQELGRDARSRRSSSRPKTTRPGAASTSRTIPTSATTSASTRADLFAPSPKARGAGRPSESGLNPRAGPRDSSIEHCGNCGIAEHKLYVRETTWGILGILSTIGVNLSALRVVANRAVRRIDPEIRTGGMRRCPRATATSTCTEGGRSRTEQRRADEANGNTVG